MGKLLNVMYPIIERLGYHVIANNFYEPIPDSRSLKPNCWYKSGELAGVDLQEKKQRMLLSYFAGKYGAEFNSWPVDAALIPMQYFCHNGSFESGDGEIFYCLIREQKPKRIIEVGSGNSTLVALQAIEQNRKEKPDYHCDYTVIDPYPNDKIKSCQSVKLVASKVQDVPLSVFEVLEDNDFLFIDSSHVLAVGSDVQYEYLDVLPRLKKGVFVHSHDIFLPNEYPKNWVIDKHRFWSEQYLLQAFLALNGSFEVVWAGNFMHSRHKEELKLFCHLEV